MWQGRLRLCLSIFWCSRPSPPEYAGSIKHIRGAAVGEPEAPHRNGHTRGQGIEFREKRIRFAHTCSLHSRRPSHMQATP